MRFKIITPLRTALDLEVTGLKLPATQGEMEVLPGHADLITSIANGELTYTPADGIARSLFVGGGFLQVEHGDVLLVTDTALEAASIDTDTVQAALERAQKALRDRASVLSREEQTYLETCIAKQLAMMEYSRRRKR